MNMEVRKAKQNCPHQVPRSLAAHRASLSTACFSEQLYEGAVSTGRLPLSPELSPIWAQPSWSPSPVSSFPAFSLLQPAARVLWGSPSGVPPATLDCSAAHTRPPPEFWELLASLYSSMTQLNSVLPPSKALPGVCVSPLVRLV